MQLSDSFALFAFCRSNQIVAIFGSEEAIHMYFSNFHMHIEIDCGNIMSESSRLCMSFFRQLTWNSDNLCLMLRLYKFVHRIDRVLRDIFQTHTLSIAAATTTSTSCMCCGNEDTTAVIVATPYYIYTHDILWHNIVCVCNVHSESVIFLAMKVCASARARLNVWVLFWRQNSVIYKPVFNAPN